MAKNYNLTGQEIRNTYDQLGQVSGSIEGGVSGSAIVDGTGSRITTLHVTASNASNAISSSYAVQADSASFAPNNGVTSIIAGTGISVDQATGTVTVTNTEGAAATGSLLVTASNVDATITYTKGDGSTFQNIINNVANATEAEDLVITVKNTSGGTLAKGTAVHAVSVTGENVDVIAASNDSASAMPAIGILSQQITNNSAGSCIIAGRDTGLDTSGLVAGASVYVHTGGALTATKPTGSALIQNIGTAAKINGSDGEIIVQGAGRTNDLPNLTEGYAWVGDTNGVPQAVATSSFAGDSFPYTGSAQITGSLGVTGSATVSSTISSLGGSIQALGGGGITVGNSGYALQYPSVNVYTNSGSYGGQIYGSHRITDLSGNNDVGILALSTFNSGDPGRICFETQFNSDVVWWISENKNNFHVEKQLNALAGAQITGSLDVSGAITGSSATFQSASIGYLQTVTGSATIIGDEFIVLNADSPTARYAGLKVYDSGSGLTGSFEWDSLTDNWIQVETGGSSAVMLTGASGSKGTETYPTSNTLLKGTGNHTVVDSSITDSGTFVNIENPVRINGNSNITGSWGVNGTINAGGSIVQTAGSIQALGGNGGNGITIGSSGYGLQYPSMNIFTDSASYAASGGVYAAHRLEDRGTGDFATFAFSTFNADDPGNLALEVQYNNDIVWWISQGQDRFHVNKEIKAVSGLQATGSVDITGSLTLNGSAVGGPAVSASFASTASYVNTLDQELIITGSVQNHVITPILSGSFPNYTASLDCSAGNMFDIDLDNGSTYHFEANNLQKGQTFMLRTPQSSDGNGQVTWGSMFNWPAGTAPTATQAQNTADLYTFVTFDTTEVYSIQSADLK